MVNEVSFFYFSSLKWDDSQCKCSCGEDPANKVRDCFYKLNRRGVWNASKCACECNSMYKCNPKLQAFNVLNPATCECTCAVVKCPAGKSLVKKSGKKWCYCK